MSDRALRHREGRRPADVLRHHGDAEIGPGLDDFAVNVRGDGPPEWLRDRLVRALDRVGPYPSADDVSATREQVARRHGRRPDEVLLLAGVAEGFAMLPALNPSLAAVIHPSFTEPDVALVDAAVRVHRVVLEAPYTIGGATVPDAADLVVVGNPTNPTSILHSAADLLALRRPGRILIVDEAFADCVPGEPESLSGHSLPDVVVLRSLTKSFAIAGLRCGYALGAPDVLDRLSRGRAPWPVGTLQLEAIRACTEPEAVRYVADDAVRIAAERAHMESRFAQIGVDVTGPASASYLLLRIPGGGRVRKSLRDNGFAVRRCDTFPGLTTDHLRVAVREASRADRLIDALAGLL